MTNAPLNVFWWRREPNFGDAINFDILSYMSKREVKYTGLDKAELIAIGSILGGAYKSGRGGGISVWGAGARNPSLKPNGDIVNFAAVRGPLSADIIGVKNVVFGDPGLLITDLVEREQKQKIIGIVLHHSKQPSDHLLDFVDKNSDLFCIINPVNRDYLSVVRKISSCSHIVSSSLHGLVMADTYGIPSTWLDPVGNHDTPRFKFRDYAAGVGRDLGMPLMFDDLIPYLASLKLGRAQKLSYSAKIEEVKSNLRSCFPTELIAS